MLSKVNLNKLGKEGLTFPDVEHRFDGAVFVVFDMLREESVGVRWLHTGDDFEDLKVLHNDQAFGRGTASKYPNLV